MPDPLRPRPGAKLGHEVLMDLYELISPLDNAARRVRYLRQEVERADTVRDWERRYRWDLFNEVEGWRVIPDDQSITDEHIDTALRQVVTRLGGPD